MMEAMEDAAESKSTPSLYPPSSITIVSKSSVYPDQPSTLGSLNLSVFDLHMLALHYTQLGLLFPRPKILPSPDLINLLRSSLSCALSFYPPLAGRLSTDTEGSLFVDCNDAGVDFVHAVSPGLSLADVAVHDSDVAVVTKELFLLNGVANLEGYSFPLAAVQVTELADGVFVGCSINHAVADGTSFWNFINAWSELCRGVEEISRPPDFHRDLPKYTPSVPCLPVGSTPSPLIRDRVFCFSEEAIRNLKARANSLAGIEGEISSFQSLCAQLWRSVTRARKLSPGSKTSLRLAANCCNRMEPPLGTHYFGNAIVPVSIVANAEEVVEREVGWCAQLLHHSVASIGDDEVRRVMQNWKEEREPRILGINSDGSFLAVGWSPRFAVYENDMGWGRPVAVLSGIANKVDGVVFAYPGREGRGSVDLEVCLPPETMASLVTDGEFMQSLGYPSNC